jgi:hypothetical protein
MVKPIVIDIEVSFSMFTFLVGCQVHAVNLPPGDVILAQLACPTNGIVFLFSMCVTNLSFH